MKCYANDNRRKPLLTTTQLILGILALLVLDLALDGYLDMKQAMEKHYSYLHNDN